MYHYLIFKLYIGNPTTKSAKLIKNNTQKEPPHFGYPGNKNQVKIINNATSSFYFPKPMHMFMKVYFYADVFLCEYSLVLVTLYIQSKSNYVHG